MKNYFFSTIVVGLFGILLAQFGTQSLPSILVNQVELKALEIVQNGYLPITLNKPILFNQQRVSLAFVGDIMLDRGVAQSVAKNGRGDFGWLFTELGDLKKSDILFGNLEGPLSDRGENVGSIYSFRMRPETADILAQAGFDILSVANNHIGDWSLDAALDTVERLNSAGITPVGWGKNWLDTTKPKIIEKNNLRVGFLAFSDVGPAWLAASEKQAGIILANDIHLANIIEAAAGTVDHLIVSFHFGEEYQNNSNLRQQELARLAIDYGARIVVGHHPHVAQEIERYRDGLIAYSLGNFIFDQYFSPETMRGLVLEVELDKREIKSARTRLSEQDTSFRPSLSLESSDV